MVTHVRIRLKSLVLIADKHVEVLRMRFLRVQYDGYNRQFKLMDRGLSSEIQDGRTYLIADLSLTDFMSMDELDVLEADHTPA